MDIGNAIQESFQWNRCGFKNGFVNFAFRIYFDIGEEVWNQTLGQKFKNKFNLISMIQCENFINESTVTECSVETKESTICNIM